MGRAANGADAAADGMRWVQFLNVLRVWPPTRVGDEAEAYEVFCRLMAAGHRLHALIEAVKTVTLERGADVPWLSEALAIIERGQARRASRQ